MDFEISQEGTLMRYSGAGGDVVIPEGVKFIEHYSVFDNADKITSLTLPKSFLGRKFKIDYRNGFVYNATDNSVSHCFVNTRASKKVASLSGRYSYLFIPSLSRLERYIVHPENPVYESVDGVLYSSCRTFLIHMPESFKDTLTLDDNFWKVLKPADGTLFNVDEVTYTRRYISADMFDEIASWCYPKLTLIAPNVTRCEPYNEHGRWNIGNRHITVIMPKLPLSEENIASVGWGLLAGYCLNQEFYDAQSADAYIQMLLRYECELYRFAKEVKAPWILDFYKKEWSQKRLPKIDRSSDVGSAHYLLEVVLRGSAQDLQQLLDESLQPLTESLWRKRNAIQAVDYAIALAIRYGGVDKLRLLLDAEAKLQRKPKTLSEEIHSKLYNYWVTGDHLFCSYQAHSAFAITSNDEVRNMTPLDEDERLKCLELLCDREILIIEDNRDFNMICTLALLCCDFKIANYILSRGVNLQRFMQEEKEYLRDVNFYNWLYSAHFNHFPGVVKFIELLASDEKPVSYPPSCISVIIQEWPDEFAKIFNLLDVKAKDLVELFEQAILSSSHSAVNTIINSKHIKSRQTLGKLLDVATKHNAHEATAMLLERQQESKSKTKTKKTSKKSSSLSL